MPENLQDRLEFSYDNIGASSYLIIKTGQREDILEYQVSMTSCNRIEKLVQFDLKCVNGYAYCYYNITSKLALSFFLKRRQLSRNEFVKLLADMVRTIVDSTGYLLSDYSFLLDSDYIFINPENLEISMIYVPVGIEGDTCKAFKDFIINLILQLADIEENGSDNFMQRILAFVKNDLFNFFDFLKLLDSMLFSKETDEAVSMRLDGGQLASKLEQGFPESNKKSVDKGVMPVLIALLSQLVIAVLVLLVIKYIKLPSGNSIVNNLALILIVLAVDIIILKNVFKGVKLFNKSEGINEAGCNRLTDAFADTDDGKVQEEKLEIRINPAISSNTVLLGSIKNGFPIFKSRSNPGIEDIVIDKPDFIIGRLKEQVDFASKSTAVGKIHAQILSRNDVWFLKDLNSVNGTFLNDCRISSNVEYQMKDGDNIAFANNEYMFMCRIPAPESRRVL